MTGPFRRTTVATAALAVLLAACSHGGGPAGQPGGGSSTSPTPNRIDPTQTGFTHVVILVMENREYTNIIGNTGKVPYINALANRYALADKFYGTTHPSLPNYLALLAGSTFGVTTNCLDCHFPDRSLVDQLEEAGISWKAYMDGMPSPCFTGPSAGHYAKKHNPFVYFDLITGNPERCAKVVPLTQLAADERAHALPSFVFITPDECHDMHSCPLPEADAFLSKLVPGILSQLGRRGVLFLTWDEGASNLGCCEKAGGGHVATIVAGPGARPKTRSSTPYDHYSILRTIEESWGLPLLGDAACTCTKPMNDLVR
jgi:phospholipase C